MDPHGLRVCKDGPVFNGELLVDSEFGEYKRGASGIRVGGLVGFNGRGDRRRRRFPTTIIIFNSFTLY